MHHLPSLFSFFSPFPNRFKSRQNAPFTVLVLKKIRRLLSSSRPYFVLIQNMYTFSYRSYKYRSKQYKKGKLCDLVFKMLTSFPNRFKQCQNCMLQRHCFHFFYAVQNRFEGRQNAPFIVIVFKFPPQFKIVSNTVRMHHLRSLLQGYTLVLTFPHGFSTNIVSFFLLQFQISFKNSIKRQALVTLFSKC